MFEKILIANRGEIALRIIRACKELGIKTVAVYSEADVTSLHVRYADEKICIGPPPPSESYLDPRRIISAAEITSADAIHPGYGFLAENPDFAEICQSCNIIFIGPGMEILRSLGDKAYAKKTMKAAGVNVIPGSDGVVDDYKTAEAIADSIGYPIMVKAVAGGGGRGMRLVTSASELRKLYDMARAEAAASFGNPDVYFERYITHPRHIEIQILGDSHGNIVHLGERDCTIQRRHQKLIEESPSPVMTAPLREKMGQAAIAGAKAVGYTNAGTFEFLVDTDGNYYFMEANTRIQVEHPVTEELTGIDLVQEQIKVAAGDKLSFGQQDITFTGHTFECRINAEDPERNFAPCPGRIVQFIAPGGHNVRMDTHIYSGYDIPPNYDSLLAKLIVSGRNRQEAIGRVLRCLDEMVIDGIATTKDFYKKIFRDSDFVLGLYDNTFVERFMAPGGVESDAKEGQLAKEET